MLFRSLGNSGDARAVPPLIDALQDEEALVRGHAAWGLGQLGGAAAYAALRARLAEEQDADVRAEIELALGSAHDEGAPAAEEAN